MTLAVFIYISIIALIFHPFLRFMLQSQIPKERVTQMTSSSSILNLIY